MPPDMRSSIFPAMRGSVLIDTSKWVLALALYAAASEAAQHLILQQDVRLGSGLKETIGLVLGMLLVFRTNSSYARWWEGRVLWGGITNNVRTYIADVCNLADLDDEDCREAARIAGGLPCAIRDSLRGTSRLQAVPGFEDATDDPKHVPLYLISRGLRLVRRWRRQGKIGDQDIRSFENHLSNIVDAFGGCERILKTPMPKSYVKFVRIIIGAYLLSIPWVVESHVVNIPLMMVMSYFMISLEVIAEAIEQPFGDDPDDLRLDDYCASMRLSVEDTVRWREQAAVYS